VDVVAQEVLLCVLLLRGFKFIFQKTTSVPCSIMAANLVLIELYDRMLSFGIPKHGLVATAQDIADDVDLRIVVEIIDLVDFTAVDLIHGLDYLLL